MGGICVERRGDGGTSNGAPVACALETTRRGVESVVDGGRFRGAHVAVVRGERIGARGLVEEKPPHTTYPPPKRIILI